MIGEIGGDAEERAAAYIKDHVTKPVVGYVAGFTAPEGKTMGHAGAIVSGSSGTAAAKKEALEAVGVKVGKTPSEAAALMREILQSLLSRRTPIRQRPPRGRDPQWIADESVLDPPDYGRASYTLLNGVSATRRNRVKPASVTTWRMAASPAWAPRA